MKYSDTRKIKILRPKSTPNDILDVQFPLKIHAGEEQFEKYCEQARNILDLLVKPEGWSPKKVAWLRDVKMQPEQLETFIAALICQAHEIGYPFNK